MPAGLYIAFMVLIVVALAVDYAAGFRAPEHGDAAATEQRLDCESQGDDAA
jgi:hypothetical protein